MDSTDTLVTALESLASTQARLVASVALVLCALLVAYVLAPYAIYRSVRTAQRTLDDRNAHRWLGTIREQVGWPFPTTAVVRTLQAAISLVTALLLLVIWGYVDTALLVTSVLVAALPYAVRILLTIVLVAAAVIGTRLLEARLESYTEDVSHFDDHQKGVTFRVLQVTIFTAVGFAALSLWNVDLSGLLIGAGFLGIVFGMAARQTLGSLVAGFVLMFSRPFEIGDWVVVDDHDGIVTDITIINTRLQNFDSETVVLPNDKVANSTIINRSKRNRLRLTVEVDVDYDTDVERAEAVALEAVDDVEVVAPAPKPDVFPRRLDDSAVVLAIRFWIENPSAPKKNRANAAVIRSVKAAFEADGITIPFPQRELSSRKGVRLPVDHESDHENDGSSPDTPASPTDADSDSSFDADSEADGDSNSVSTSLRYEE